MAKPNRSLLDCPGEVRNRIYNLAVEEQTVSLKHTPTADLIQLADPPVDSKRLFFGLTQVCHRIRSEFLPLHRAQATVSVRPRQLYEYIDTFLKLDGMAAGDVVGNLCINFATGDKQIVDIKPLLQLMEKAKHLSVKIRGTTLVKDDEDLNQTLRKFINGRLGIRKESRFRRYLQHAVVSLYLSYSPLSYDLVPISITFAMRYDYWKPWMEHWHAMCEGQSCKCKSAWSPLKEWSLVSGIHLDTDCRETPTPRFFRPARLEVLPKRLKGTH